MRKVDTLRRSPEKRPPAKRAPRAAFSSWNILRYRLLALFAIIGPGFITANVDNDPGGILTYSQAGAKYGYTLLWTLIPTTVALIVVQEMAARMGAITGKGLSDLIREEFGLRMTFFTMIVLGMADFGNIAAEFAGLASGMKVFGVSPYGRPWDWRRSTGLDSDRARFLQACRTRPVDSLDDLFRVSGFGHPRSSCRTGSWRLTQTVIPQFEFRSRLSGDDRRPGSAPPSHPGCSSTCRRRSSKKASQNAPTDSAGSTSSSAASSPT